jgi:hypothetical protein
MEWAIVLEHIAESMTRFVRNVKGSEKPKVGKIGAMATKSRQE